MFFLADGRSLGSSSLAFRFVSNVRSELVDSLFCPDERTPRDECIQVGDRIAVYGAQFGSWRTGVGHSSLPALPVMLGSFSIETSDAMLSSLSLFVTEAGRAILVLFLSSRSAFAALVYVGDMVIGDALVDGLCAVVPLDTEAFRSKNATAFFVFDGDGRVSWMDLGGDDGGVACSTTSSSDWGSSDGECDRDTRHGELGSRGTRSMFSASPSECVFFRKSNEVRLSVKEEEARLSRG